MKKITVLVGMLFPVFLSFAQSDTEKARVSAAYQIYQQQIPLHQMLRIGRSYEHFYLSTEGNQYLVDPVPRTGELLYEGVWYPEITLNYDIYNELIFVSFTLEGYHRSVILNEKRVGYMNLHGMRFVYLSEDTNKQMPAGIYQEAYAGKAYSFWIKRKKKLNNNSVNSSNGNRYKFVQTDLYYLKNGEEVTRFSGKSDLLKTLGSTPEVMAVIRENKLRLKPGKPEFVQEVTELLRLLEQKP
ncbi:MAG: hypothetical protein SF052_03730 [Bacteroidia bacterium]|nr:hypothetical protein [Bacteroidia bacterium]